MLKRKIEYMVIVAIVVMAFLCAGCNKDKKSKDVSGNQKKLNVVTTIYPYYDFIKVIAGDKVNLTWLLPAGTDPHAFEPSAKDMQTVEGADLFIYNGGDMEAWVDKVLKSMDSKKRTNLKMMDFVQTVEEETVEGMTEESEEEGDEGEVEYDEHIWTSPKNAILIVKGIANKLMKLDSKNQSYYKSNAEKYVKKLEKLDDEIKDVMKHKVRDRIVVGDKFPLRYLVEDYKIEYRAAFVGCSAETEPSAKTMHYLIDYVKKNKIPFVLHIENSSCKVANTISEETGAKQLEFNSLHTVNEKQLKEHATYLDIMKQNVAVLKKALDE